MNKIPMPPLAISVIERLEEHGHKAYLAGGSVRDALLRKPSKDVDVVTDALPDQVATLFPHHVADGKDQGVIKAITIGGQVVDIATMRLDGNYSDGRRPDQVIFTKDIEADMRRRDFTINGLFANKHGAVIDLVGGLDDLQRHIVRAIGDPVNRFDEDHLRMLRAVRFMTTLNFQLHKETYDAISSNCDWLSTVSAERVWSELWRIIESPFATRGVNYLIGTGLLQHILPEVVNCAAIKQDPKHHPEGDVLIHTVMVFQALSDASPTARLAGLLHDIGKAMTSSVKIVDHDYRISHLCHEHVGAKMADEALRRLTCPTAIRERIVWLVDNHMRAHKVRDMRRSKLVSFLRDAKAHDCLNEMIALQHADSISSGNADKSCREFLVATPVTDEVILAPLLVDGKDVMALGVPQGKRIGEILADVREQQDQGTITTRDHALKFIEYLVKPSGVLF